MNKTAKHSLAFLLALVLLLAAVVPVVMLVADAETDEAANPLDGKSVLFVGDSICEASCEWGDPAYGETVGWAGRIIANNNMTGENLGYSGASVSNVRNGNTVLAQLQKRSGVHFDYVIMHGGVNDAWDSAPVGEMTDAGNFTGPYDLSTFAGGLETMFMYAKKAYKEAEYGYIINFSLPGASYGSLSDMSGYFDMAKRICEKWNIPYLDLYGDTEFNRTVLKTHTSTYLPDFIHPNSGGYDLLAPVIEDWMKGLTEAEITQESTVPSEGTEEPLETGSEQGTVSSADVSENETGIPVYGYVLLVGCIVAVAAVVGIMLYSKKQKAK